MCCSMSRSTLVLYAGVGASSGSCAAVLRASTAAVAPLVALFFAPAAVAWVRTVRRLLRVGTSLAGEKTCGGRRMERMTVWPEVASLNEMQGERRSPYGLVKLTVVSSVVLADRRRCL